ncbi:MAG: UbiA family prenyltransferase [Planctomycetota bacterium]|nr:UbiA family prenyltransferase [Planctomycetota bacterium]
MLTRLGAVLQLTRVTTAFAAVGNVWFIILWTRANEQELLFAPPLFQEDPLWLLLTGGAIYAVALFAFATALNDTLDVRRDRLLNPERPLAAGRLSLDTAVTLVAATLLIAVLGSTLLGQAAVLMCLFTIAGVLFHNAAAKYVPAVGLVSLGLVYGAHMMTANCYLVFVWPVVLVMTHALLLGAVTHALARKRPALTRRMILVAGLGWAFWCGVLIYVGKLRAGTFWPEWVSPMAMLAPVLLAVCFAAFAWNKARSTRDPARAADKLRRYGAFWVTLYGVGWMLGQGRLREAALLGALTIVGLLGMTVLRELYGLIEHPIGYRRA